MRSGYRPLIVAILLVTFLILIKVRLYDIWDQYNVPAYIGSSLGFGHDDYNNMPLLGKAGDKAIVMAKMESQDTTWVTENLPEWQHFIYTVDNGNASLHTPANKGHESMAYLTYVIDHYDNLPAVTVFIHPHRNGFWGAWHTDTSSHDNVVSLRRLQLDFVQRNGYANLRCNWGPGCRAADRKNEHITPEIWQQFFSETKLPDEVGAACCAQFAVSKEQVLRRPREDYLRYRQWILDTEFSDKHSGRVLEFLWHVIFGKHAVYCPDQKTCYCEVYGQC